MNSICVIPAKGISKRLPGKNTKCFHGKPVIEYTIGAALDSECFEQVIVSTDEKHIGDIAQAAGAEVFYRSARTCTDTAPMVSAVLEILDFQQADLVCMAYACAPFIKAETIRAAENILRKGHWESVFPVYKTEPIERSVIKSNGYFIARFPEYNNVNSQLYPKSYQIAGQFFFSVARDVQKYETLMLPRSWGLEVLRWEAIDIDTVEDWAYAEMLYAIVKKRVAI